MKGWSQFQSQKTPLFFTMLSCCIILITNQLLITVLQSFDATDKKNIAKPDIRKGVHRGAFLEKTEGEDNNSLILLIHRLSVLNHIGTCQKEFHTLSEMQMKKGENF